MNRQWNPLNGKLARSGKHQSAALLAAIALVFGLLGPATIRATSNSSQNRGAAAPAPTPNKTYGWKSAPITMEVFSDYQCPYCRVFYDATLRQVIATYVASGKVYLIHRDFPLVIHRYSGEAARWANACAEVGQFESAEAALYDNQDSWGADGNIGKYVAAALPAADFKRVEALMRNGAMPAPQASGSSLDPMAGVSRPCPVDPYISQDIKLGYQFHVTGTPTFIITYKGRQFSVPATGVSWPVLKQFFDTLLQQ
jgi:protein-disulfide isomerase